MNGCVGTEVGAVVGPQPWVWGVYHWPFFGVPASMRLVRGTPLISGMSPVKAQLLVQMLAREETCESVTVTTVGDAGHQCGADQETRGLLLPW